MISIVPGSSLQAGTSVEVLCVYGKNIFPYVKASLPLSSDGFFHEYSNALLVKDYNYGDTEIHILPANRFRPRVEVLPLSTKALESVSIRMVFPKPEDKVSVTNTRLQKAFGILVKYRLVHFYEWEGFYKAFSPTINPGGSDTYFIDFDKRASTKIRFYRTGRLVCWTMPKKTLSVKISLAQNKLEKMYYKDCMAMHLDAKALTQKVFDLGNHYNPMLVAAEMLVDLEK